MANLENLKKDAAYSILAKGLSGSGKTTASCGKDFRPVFVFDTDQRMQSVANYYKKLDGHCKDIEYQSFVMREHFKELDKKMDEIYARPVHKTVVMASLTSYIHNVLAHVLNFKAGANTGKKVADIHVNSIEDYNVEDAALIFEMVAFMKSLQARGTNVILEAHITPIEIKALDGSSSTSMEILTKGRKAPAQLPGYFDEVWLFDTIRRGVNNYEYIMHPRGDAVTRGCKTSRDIPDIEWTNKDFSLELKKEMDKMMGVKV